MYPTGCLEHCEIGQCILVVKHPWGRPHQLIELTSNVGSGPGCTDTFLVRLQSDAKAKNTQKHEGREAGKNYWISGGLLWKEGCFNTVCVVQDVNRRREISAVRLDRQNRRVSEHHALHPLHIDDPKQNSTGNQIERSSWRVMTLVVRTQRCSIVLRFVFVFRESLVVSLNLRE